jgi:hypothetical protein
VLRDDADKVEQPRKERQHFGSFVSTVEADQMVAMFTEYLDAK